jgi:hypothetical protein
MFIPFVIYMALVLYYFSFVITDPNNDHDGFHRG